MYYNNQTNTNKLIKKHQLINGSTNHRLMKYKYIAFTTNTTYSKDDINELMHTIASHDITFNWCVATHPKVHVHGYVLSSEWYLLDTALQATDHKAIYKPLFDLSGWESYLLKQGNITQLLKRN